MADIFENMTTMNHSTVHPFTTMFFNGTTAGPASSYPVAYGFLSVGVAVILFGSNFVPVKKFETGDGMFFQLITCMVIWASGLVMNAIRDFPTFHPLAMLGGCLWCTGNVMCVPIIKTIGLGQGICIWASFNLIFGWASGRFGWFGLKPEVPHSLVLNYLGVCLCMISAVVYMFMRTSVHAVEQPQSAHPDDEHQPLLRDERGLLNDASTSVEAAEGSIYDRMSLRTKRIVGTCMAAAAGTFFGLNFVPVTYIQDNYPGEQDKHTLDFVFSHFCGIFVSSLVYFAIYCALMRNRPKVYPRAVLPAMVSGIMWAIADMGWFVANDSLSPAISFPMITSIPAIVGSLWGIYFKEIQGMRNLLILLGAVLCAVSGSVLTGLSKMDMHKHHNDTLHSDYAF